MFKINKLGQIKSWFPKHFHNTELLKQLKNIIDMQKNQDHSNEIVIWKIRKKWEK